VGVLVGVRLGVTLGVWLAVADGGTGEAVKVAEGGINVEVGGTDTLGQAAATTAPNDSPRVWLSTKTVRVNDSTEV